MLGAVREIQSYRLVMSLPFNMTGSVNIGNISDPLANLAQQQVDQNEQRDEDKPLTDLSQLFHVGQVLPCFVLDVDTQRRHAQLTINPRLVNSQIVARNLRLNMVCDLMISYVKYSSMYMLLVSTHSLNVRKHVVNLGNVFVSSSGSLSKS